MYVWINVWYLFIAERKKSVISSVLAFCPSVTLKKRSYEGLAPPRKLSQIVEINNNNNIQFLETHNTIENSLYACEKSKYQTEIMIFSN